MTVYSIYVFNKKCESIFFSEWNTAASESRSAGKENAGGDEGPSGNGVEGDPETAKLVYGVVFSLKNMVNKMTAGKDSKEGFLSYKTNTYKLHYFESPAGVKIVLITDANCGSMHEVLRQIYSKLYVEFVVKNPLATPNTPIRNELFKLGLEKFIRTLPNFE